MNLDDNQQVEGEPNTGYIINGTGETEILLPLSADLAVGDVVRVGGAARGTWKVSHEAGQVVRGPAFATGFDRWAPREVARTWVDVATSADGQRLVAAATSAALVASNDYGQTWTSLATSGSRAWTAVASSADGLRLAATTGSTGSTTDRVYTSTDGGATWTSSSLVLLDYFDVAMSADAGLLAVAAGDRLMLSTDFGASYTTARSGLHVAVACAADASLVLGLNDTTVYTIAAGDPGTERLTVAGGWREAAVSADGSHAVVVGALGVYTSSDGGLSWIQRQSFGSWTGVAISADGATIAAARGDGILMSSDFGLSWAKRMNATGNIAVALSADGTRALAGVSGSTLFTASLLGGLTGGALDSVELQYVGRDTFVIRSHEGAIAPY